MEDEKPRGSKRAKGSLTDADRGRLLAFLIKVKNGSIKPSAKNSEEWTEDDLASSLIEEAFFDYSQESASHGLSPEDMVITTFALVEKSRRNLYAAIWLAQSITALRKGGLKVQAFGHFADSIVTDLEDDILRARKKLEEAATDWGLI